MAVIAILAVVAIMTFLGNRNRSHDAAAVSDLRNAASLVTAIWSGDEEDGPAFPFLWDPTADPQGDLTGSLVADMIASRESSLAFTTGPVSPTDHDVSVWVDPQGAHGVFSPEGTLYMTRASESGVAYVQRIRPSSKVAQTDSSSTIGWLKVTSNPKLYGGTNSFYSSLYLDEDGDPVADDPFSELFDSSTYAAPGGGAEGGDAEDDGTTSTTEGVEDTTPTTEPPNLLLPVAVAVANNHGCALNVAGGAWCWGSASKGVLGNGLTSGTFASPTQVLAGVPFKALDLSDTHSCAVDMDGQAWCWGDAERGKLGNGETAGTFPLPQPVDSDVEFTMIEAGNDHTCALGVDGAAWCWGFAQDGRLGNGETSGMYTTPQPVAGDHRFVDIAVGSAHTCAIDTDGKAWCWGSQANGRLGNGVTTTTAQPIPVEVNSDLAFIDIGASVSHSCAIDTDGKAWCWGNSSNKKLGNNATTGWFPEPVQVVGNHTYTSISVSTSHNCATAANGQDRCWGNGISGKLGNGVTTNQDWGPVVIIGDSFSKLAASPAFTCGITTDHVLKCWGLASGGRLGTGVTSGSYGTPQTVASSLG